MPMPMSRSKTRIPIFKAEREAGIAQAILDNASISYAVLVEPLSSDSSLHEPLRVAFAAEKGSDEQFDLYYLKDVLVSTGVNKNKDVFEKATTWAARHTPEDKPFNFEHRPLDIIGHITSSRVVDDNMNEIDDDTAVDDLPDKFHIVNGSVLYMELDDPERKRLMEQTVAEIKKGEWYVSMECLFSGFDYGIEDAAGSQRIVTRDKSTAFLTKHLVQYGGTGVYTDPTDGNEYSLSRVLRNIVFSGKGLVRKPANLKSIILNTVAAFTPLAEDSGYLKARQVATSIETEEQISMPESNATDEALRDSRDANRKLSAKIEELTQELAKVQSKDTETTIASLREEVTARDKTIAGLNAQLTAIKESSKTIQDRAEKAEADLKVAQDALNSVKASETKRARVEIMKNKGAEAAAAEKLVNTFSVLDDQAFADAVDTIAPSWVKPEAEKPAKTDPVVAAINKAKPEPEPALATASEESGEAARTAVVDFLGKSRAARAGRTPVLAGSNED